MSGFLPTDICNQALDAAAIDFTLGDIEEGTRPAQVCLRAYSECLRQLLRAAPWDFARREVDLVLLADATGQTANVGSTVPSGFIYEYGYPQDCARLRYIPWCPFQTPPVPPGNIQIATTPQTTVSQPPYAGQRIIPSRFLITNDPNFAAISGQVYWETQGLSPQGRVVILSNVQNARCVYTFTALYPSTWDHLFRAAMVAYLASEIAISLAKDKKFGLTMRAQNIEIAKQKITQARISDGNEMWASSDIRVDWMDFRNAGRGGPWGPNGSWGGDCGCFGPGWGGTLGFSDGSAY